MDPIQQVREWLATAQRVCVLTGAGVSAESGIPTFRGAGGLWRQHRAEELATPAGFAKNPALVWEWYDWRRSIVAKAEPNAAHRALAEMEARLPHFTLVTQNVDGLHARAGSKNVLELHGSLWRTRCTLCASEEEDHRIPLPEIPPKCGCGGLLRPAIVWFGEGLPSAVWHNAEEAVRTADLFLVIGTSAVVYPAASLAPLAKSRGARVVEVNTDSTPLSQIVDLSVRAAAGEAVPRLLE